MNFQSFAGVISTHSSVSVNASEIDYDQQYMTNSNSNPDFHMIAVYSKAKETQPIPQQLSYSQAKQDLVILALTEANDAKKKKNHTAVGKGDDDNDRQKFFVDLASNDAAYLSNTLLLEQNNWRGLCLEPNPIYWYRLASYRTCSIIGAMVGGEPDEDGTEVDVTLPRQNIRDGTSGGIIGDDMDNKKKDGDLNQEKRNLVSISTVFEAYRAPKIIDYLSLDVEGAETLVMEHFDWDRYKFKFLTVERPKDNLRDMFLKNGYKEVKKITFWGESLWINQALVLLTQEDVDAIFKEKSLNCFKCTGWWLTVDRSVLRLKKLFVVGMLSSSAVFFVADDEKNDANGNLST